MKNIMHIDELDGLPSFVPANHSGTVNHRLAWSGNGAKTLAVWHGELEPGGEAEEHVHEGTDQAFYVLDGQCLFRLREDEHHLSKGNFVFVPQNVPHRILATGEGNLKLLVIMAPPPAET